VGTERKINRTQTKNGLYFLAPDNGLLTFIMEDYGVLRFGRLDESKNRLPNSNNSYTFTGVIFLYMQARNSHQRRSDSKRHGPVLKKDPVHIKYQKPLLENGVLHGISRRLMFNMAMSGQISTGICFSKTGVEKGDALECENTAWQQDSL